MASDDGSCGAGGRQWQDVLRLFHNNEHVITGGDEFIVNRGVTPASMEQSSKRLDYVLLDAGSGPVQLRYDTCLVCPNSGIRPHPSRLQGRVVHCQTVRDDARQAVRATVRPPGCGVNPLLLAIIINFYGYHSNTRLHSHAFSYFISPLLNIRCVPVCV